MVGKKDNVCILKNSIIFAIRMYKILSKNLFVLLLNPILVLLVVNERTFFIMGMYHRVQLMKVNGLLDMPIQNLIYIYKITSKHTGHYYIGQTSSIKDRCYNHLSTIIKLIEGDSCKPLLFHKVIAEKIKELHEKDKRVKIERFTREALEVYVMALVADNETANLVESHYIKKNIHNEMCLNVKK